jgi:tetratricopeptide (TPR) repeat protein
LSLDVAPQNRKDEPSMANKRGKQKVKPKRRKRIGTAIAQINTRRMLDRARKAFHEDNDADQALTLLQQIEAQGYMSFEALGFYLEVLHELRNFDDYARVATVMAEQRPADPNANLFAASGAHATAQPVSAILLYERLLKLAPDHPGAPTVEKELARLRHQLPEFLEAFIDDLPKDLPRVASVEKVLHVFKLGRLEDTIKRAEEHLRRYPNDLKIRNNLAEALAHQGDTARALSLVNETLAMAPDNFFARAVRCRLAYRQGRVEESRADAEALVPLNPRQINDLTKAAESFAHTGEEA